MGKNVSQKNQQKKVNIFSHISNEIELKKNDDEEEEDVGIKFSGCFFWNRFLITLNSFYLALKTFAIIIPCCIFMILTL